MTKDEEMMSTLRTGAIPQHPSPEVVPSVIGAEELHQMIILKEWKRVWYLGGHGGILIEITTPYDDVRKGKMNCLHYAALTGSVEAVRLLMQSAGGKAAKIFIINGPKYHNPSAMMLAAAEGHAEIVRLLMSVEARMTEDWAGKTALMIAAWNGHYDVVLLLAEAEARMQDNTGVTALMLSAWTGIPGCISILAPLEAGLMDASGHTALCHACMHGSIDCARLLAPHEAGLRLPDGRTVAEAALSKTPVQYKNMVAEALASFLI